MATKSPAWQAAQRFDKLLTAKGFKDNVRLAKLLGVKDATISRYRSGERAPNPDRLTAICQTTGLSADEILGLNVDGAWPSHTEARADRKLAAIEAVLRGEAPNKR
jgi:transcriptional regulator with XRE-family HTH domain